VEPPTVDAIVNCQLVAQGVVHIKTILETGGTILGHHDLEADHAWPADESSTWGYRVLEVLAEKYFGAIQQS